MNPIEKSTRKTPTDETYQENVSPVQSFESPAIAVVPGMTLEARLGRPARKGNVEREESALASVANG